MFCGVNENFATTVIKGALALVGDSVDLDVMCHTQFLGQN
jgi:hypothetical protein